jgi:hypothetical protein
MEDLMMRRAEILFCAVCVALVLVMGLLTHYVNTRPLPEEVSVWDPSSSEAVSKAYDAYAAVNNLLITLATGLLAALGLFFTSSQKRRTITQSLWSASASALFVCVSLYWGYVSSQNVEWAIEYSVPTLGIPKLQWPRILQCSSILLGVFFFAVFLLRDFVKVDAHEGATHVSHS